jgi:aspartyl-tRNA(Asn)/glutamyl-tRNA(Gln) amidotransferase subunit C
MLFFGSARDIGQAAEKSNAGRFTRLQQGRAGASRAPMSVDTETVLRIANLARIAMSEEEAERLKPELNNILHWVEQLGEVDTSGVEPLAMVIANKTRMREDKVTDGDCRDDVLANAPLAEHGFFAVPKVIE